MQFHKETLPKILILSLKRFEFNNLGSMGRGASRRDYAFREKIETLVDFPLENLDMVHLLPLPIPYHYQYQY